MTDKQRQLARHALGLPNKQKTSFRNRFCASPGSDDFAEWEAMVSQGEAVKFPSSLWGGDSMFHLTLKAALAAREPDEHISREEAMEMRKWQLCAESSE